MRSWPPFRLITAGILLGAIGCGGAGADPDPDARPEQPDAMADGDAGGFTAHVEPASCRFPVSESLDLVEGADYVCGDLVVLEDRARPGGRLLRLHYIQIDGAGGDTATIYLDGGPGGNGANILAYLAYLGTPFVDGLLAQGDFLVIAQRGTTLSEPDLSCGGESPFECATRLSQDADLTAFTTAANADDIDDLRAALGYERLNLYGISYGSRLALEVLRRHGDRIRAAVAGGTVPSQVIWPAEIPASFYGALTGLAGACAADGSCDDAYGDLVEAFTDGVVRLNQAPAVFDYHGTDVEIYGDTYASLLFGLFYSRSAFPMMPLLITELGERRTDQVSDYLTAVFDGYGQSDLSRGLYYSVVCGELFNPADEGAFEAASAGVPTVIKETLSYSWYGLLQTCQDWPRGTPEPALAQPVSSAVPTFVPNGSFDPITPPRFGDIAAETLEQSAVMVFADSGHGATLQTPCGNDTLIDFLNAPAQPLASPCADDITLSFMLPDQQTLWALAPARLRTEIALAALPPPVVEPIDRVLRARARDLATGSAEAGP